MATNIPPHNLTELVDGIVAIIDNPEITIDDITKIITGLDAESFDMPKRYGKGTIVHIGCAIRQ